MSQTVKPLIRPTQSRAKSKSILTQAETAVLISQPEDELEFVVRQGIIISNRTRLHVAAVIFADGLDANVLHLQASDLPTACLRHQLVMMSVPDFLAKHFDLPIETAIKQLDQHLQTLRHIEAENSVVEVENIDQDDLTALVSSSDIGLSYERISKLIADSIQIADRSLKIRLRFGQYHPANTQHIDQFFGF